MFQASRVVASVFGSGPDFGLGRYLGTDLKLLHSLFGASDPRDPVSKALASAQPVQTVGPWQQAATLAIGGLTALGFDRASDRLLICSGTGQSVVSAATGEILYRNREEDGLDIAALKGTRLDHPADERFDMAGLYGGGLRTMTDDGWTVECVQGHAILHPPQASIHFHHPKWDSYKKDRSFHVLDRGGEDIRAFGFSWTSHSLVLATPSTVMLWHRPAPLKL